MEDIQHWAFWLGGHWNWTLSEGLYCSCSCGVRLDAFHSAIQSWHIAPVCSLGGIMIGRGSEVYRESRALLPFCWLQISHTDCTVIEPGPLNWNLKTKHLSYVMALHFINPLNAELNPICHLLALLGAHHILHISRIRVKY